MIVNKQREIIFRNECGCIVDESLLAKAIVWHQNKPTSANKKIYIHGRYPCVSIHNEKIHVHRLIVSYMEGRKLDRNEHVHHKNHNRLDSSVGNLEIICASEHLSKHNKGRILSLSHRKSISEAGRKRRGIKMKKRVNIPLDELREMVDSGLSINKIAKHFACDRSTIRSRLYEHPHLLEGNKAQEQASE